ncbi:hypothetical protein [Psychrilyobacter atlanticus]|uniref:hypothetical protein n=1 Tax=Psychrilyobacter atlanticus TaxID=271091 RepID=UPI00041E8C35|nr:hypothetical protein [Psychrilyobacter atlanticus]
MHEILKQLNIKKIVSIDDEWEHGENEKLWESNPVKYLEDKEEDADHGKIVKLSYYNTLRELKEKDKNLFEENFDEDDFPELYSADTPLPLKALEELFGGEIEKFCGIKNLKDEFTQNDDFTLFVVDRNLEGSGENEDSVLELLDCITKDLKVEKFMVMLYSHENLNDIKDKEAKKNYLKTNSRDLSYTYLIHPIQKKESVEEVKKELKKMCGTSLENLIYDSYLYSHLYDYLEKRKKLNQMVYDDIYHSKIFDLKTSIINAKESGEGVDSLLNKAFRTINNIRSTENGKYIESKKNLNNASNKYTKNEPRINLEEFLSENSKHTIIDYSVNIRYKDIYPGDLFKFKDYKNKNKYGLVITKSCHTILRKKGNDIARDVDKYRLLLLEKDKINNHDRSDKDNHDLDKFLKIDKGVYLWPIQIDKDSTNGQISKSWFLKVPDKKNLQIVDCNILDLCTLNNKGEAIIDFESSKEEIVKNKTYYSAEYFKGLKFDNFFDEKLKSLGLSFEGDEFNQLNYHIISKNNNISFNKSETKFKIQRIGRVMEDKTLALYQDFLAKISSPGVDVIL